MIIQKEWAKETKAYMKQILKELQAKNLIEELDESQLIMMGETYQLYLEARKSVESDGLLVHGRGDEIKTNPAAIIMLRCQAQILNIGREFGLTAKSRKKIEATENPLENTPLSLFLEKMKDEDNDD